MGKGQKIYTISCTTRYHVVSAIKEMSAKFSGDLKVGKANSELEIMEEIGELECYVIV